MSFKKKIEILTIDERLCHPDCPGQVRISDPDDWVCSIFGEDIHPDLKSRWLFLRCRACIDEEQDHEENPPLDA